MTMEQFDEVINRALNYLEEDCESHPENYCKGGEDFEPYVVEAIQIALQSLEIQDDIDYTSGSHAFPDIVIKDRNDDNIKYGVEVKGPNFTNKRMPETWKIEGNSILGSTRVPVLKTMIIFGKLQGENSLFRAREYEKCVCNISVTHSPRYQLDLDIPEGETFFDKSNLSYSELCEADNPIPLVTKYFKSIGKEAWWLAKDTPAEIQMFDALPKNQRSQLIGYAFTHFTEIFSDSTNKFNRFSIWLVMENSVITSNLRDTFTAGGREKVEANNHEYENLPKIFSTLHKHKDYVLQELRDADLDQLRDDWGEEPQEEYDERVEQWIQLVTSVVDDEDFGSFDTEQMIEDMLGE